MYERSAIVLERYFDNWLGLKDECNIRDNYKNYCNIVEKLEKYQVNYQKEVVATKEYNEVLTKIKDIQAEQKELYKKSAKLEYNRNLLFNNIDGKVEDTRTCIEKIEEEVAANNEAMRVTKEKLIAILSEYNEKRFELSKAKRYKKMAENDYNEFFEICKKNYDGIMEEDIETAKEFANFTETENIIETLLENGSSEKIPFNEDVMRCTTTYSVGLEKNEVLSYLQIYEKMTKLLEDIESGTTKINLHKKYARNEKAKVDFILATKDYIMQFLDYERMTVIHGRKSHNRLMNEACEEFKTDIIQIDNLYELILRETLNKATKKAYKELYNKSYLIDIKNKEEKFKKEKNRVNLNTATLINSNYWRIEGIRNIYTVFYKSVSEVFGRDVVEFDIPKEFDDYVDDDDSAEEAVVDIIDNEDTSKSKNAKKTTKKTTKTTKAAKVEEKEENEAPKIPFILDDMDVLDVNIDFNDNSEDEFGKYNDEVGIKEDKSEEVVVEDSKETIDDKTSTNDEEDNDEVDSEDEVEDTNQDNSTDDALDEISERLNINLDELSDDNKETSSAEFDIFGDKYKEIDFSDTINVAATNAKNTSASHNDRIYREIKFVDDKPVVEEDNLFTEVKQAKNKKNNEIETFSPVEEPKKQTGLFGRFKRNTGKRAKKFTDEDIW